MVIIRPDDPIRWAYLNEENWVHVCCGRTVALSQRHLVRMHRSSGPIFPCHKYPWAELATIGLLQDSVQPGCAGLAILWSGHGRSVQMKITDFHADSICRLSVDFTYSDFRRTLLVEGNLMGIYFMRLLLEERLLVLRELHKGI